MDCDNVYLAHVVIDFPGAAFVPRGRIADALMAVEDVVTVKVPGDGGSAEYRIDVRAPTRELAADAAAAAAHGAGRAVGLAPRVLSVKLQTERERLTALEGTRTLHPLGFRDRARVVA